MYQICDFFTLAGRNRIGLSTQGEARKKPGFFAAL